MKKRLKQYKQEFSILLKLSLPLIISYFLDAGTFLTDSIMVGNIDKYNIAAMSLSTGSCVFISLLAIGASTALASLLTGYYARKEYSQMKTIAQQFIYILVPISFIACAFMNIFPLFFDCLNIDEKTKEIAANYMFVISVFSPVIVFVHLFRPIIESFLRNKVILYVSVIAFLLNIPLNYLFIYYFNKGAVGSAYSTVLCMMIQVVVLAYFSFKHFNVFKKFPKPDKKQIIKLVKLSIPVISVMMLEEGFFITTNFLASQFGEVTLGAHHIALSIVGTVFMIQLGSSFALMQRTSYLLGKKEPIKMVTEVAFIKFLLLGSVIGSLVLLFREELVFLHTNDPDILDLGKQILTVAFIFHLVDSLQVSAMGILRALKRDNEVVKFSIFCYWLIGFGLSAVLSQYFGIFGIWFGMTASLFVVAVLYWIKVYNIVFKKEKEQENLAYGRSSS